MALPQVNIPTYELAVPSTDKKIKYRPFLVKEEKILMIAMEAEEQSGIINAVKEIVKACTFDKFDVSKLLVSSLGHGLNYLYFLLLPFL